VKLLQSVQPLQVEDLLIGQFAGDGKGNPGYLEDPTITNKSSKTETYATAVLHINNPRWAGVPFILKAGKGLDESKVEVRIRFHQVPGAIPTIANCNPNELVIRVQPNECIYWKITSKIPGVSSCMCMWYLCV
jgi:glucose-6-phosphate 1-dehydrogenase